ncbi:hypothetical protein GGR61_002889 [Xanthomonas arboricola]|nr:hypothetical protein [Xanthomonas sp. 3058]
MLAQTTSSVSFHKAPRQAIASLRILRTTIAVGVARRPGCEAGQRTTMRSAYRHSMDRNISRRILCRNRRIACVDRHAMQKLCKRSRECRPTLGLRARIAPSLIGAASIDRHYQRRLCERALGGNRQMTRSHPSAVRADALHWFFGNGQTWTLLHALRVFSVARSVRSRLAPTACFRRCSSGRDARGHCRADLLSTPAGSSASGSIGKARMC